MNETDTLPWDPAQHLESEDGVAAYLEATLEEGDPSLVALALADIVRAKGMTQLAGETGLGGDSLYQALSAEGNPEFATILKIVSAFGLRRHAAPATAKHTG